MRPHFIKTSVALFLCAPFAASGSLAAEWDGSYSANGQCFCVGAVASAVENSIIPTPVGGQTVGQICQRVGAGPGLKVADELFNYPIYADSQCGHGPFSEQSKFVDTNCAGSLDGKGAGSESCQPIGPRWAIKQAFSKQKVSEKQKITEQATVTKELVKKQADPAVKRESTKSLINKPVVTSISVKRNDDVKGTTRTLKATVISSASTAGRKLPKREPLASFTGKVITIDGKRYMQAKKGLAAQGGEPGSRIILDGLVFLLDDGSIRPNELYRTQPAKATKSKKTSKNSSKSVKQRVADISRKESASLKNKPSSKQVTPLIASQFVRGDRNNVPRALPVPRESTPAVEIARLETLDGAIERNQIPMSLVTQTPVAVVAESRSVIELAELKKADRLLHLNTNVESSSEKEATAIKSIDDSANMTQSTVLPISTVTEELKKTDSDTAASQVGFLSALKLPESLKKENERFSYIEAMPVSFDVGGSGLVVKGSSESHSKFHYVGRIGVTNTYQEAMLGGGYYLTPSSADRLTMVLQAGVEYGSFSLEDDQNPAIKANYNDTGLYFGAATRLALSHRFELRGGLGYSSFFKGDVLMFGGAYWHMTSKLDLVSQFELGDNDLVGLGIRYYY